MTLRTGNKKQGTGYSPPNFEKFGEVSLASLRGRSGPKSKILAEVQGTEKGILADNRILNPEPCPLNPEKGLTLVEVLLAVSILAFGITGVLRGFASSIAALEAGQYNIDAVNLLRAKMADVEIMVREKEEIAQESERGAFDAPFQDFLWEWDIAPTEDEGLYALTLAVYSGDHPRKFSLTTYVAEKKDEEEQ